MSSEAPNGGVTESVAARVINAEKKDTPSSEVPEKTSDANGTSAPIAVGAEPGDNPNPDKGSHEKQSEDKSPEEKQAEPTAGMGEKREHDEATSGQGDTMKTGEAPTKKQKVDEQANGEKNSAITKTLDTGAVEKPAETALNPPAKRGPGRPKKGEGNNKAPKKQSTPRSTEGIGSRTRSRAKAQA